MPFRSSFKSKNRQRLNVCSGSFGALSVSGRADSDGLRSPSPSDPVIQTIVHRHAAAGASAVKAALPWPELSAPGPLATAT